MSRCFPYNRAIMVPMNKVENKGPLIESIKLQKDKDKAKEERRKERKREKKDKKRKLEEQSKHSIISVGLGKLYEEKSLKLEQQFKSEQQFPSLKGKYIQSLRDDESSDITEEHEQPVRLAKPSYSSENSQNSDKRRKHESPANTIKADGSILKIRLSSFKNKEPSVADSDVAGPSTSGRVVDPIGRNKFEFGQMLINEPVSAVRVDPIGQNDYGYGQRLVKEQPCSTSVATCIYANLPIEKQPNLRLDVQKPNQEVAVSKSKSSTSKRSKVEVLYQSLLENWSPQMTEGCDDEEDWLFSKKSQKTEKFDTTIDAACSSASDLWPRAQFLPSVDIYALPYTVPL